MNRFAIALCLAAASGPPLAARDFEGASGSGVTVRSEYTLRYRTLYPAGRGKELGTFVTGDAAGEHRIFFDTRSGTYYGYDIHVTKSGTDGRFLLTLGPFSPEAEGQLRTAWPKMCSGCPDPHPVSSARQHFPEPQIVAPGDKIVVDLLADEKSGDVVSEEITLVSRSATPRESPARDFRAEEVELQVLHPRLRVDGQPVCKGQHAGYLSGNVIWLPLPGQGRAFFSLVARPGFAFAKTGTIAGNKLRATIGGSSYEWIAEAPVVSPDRPPYVDTRAWNVWVLHDRDFAPTGNGCLEGGGGLDDHLKKQ